MEVEETKKKPSAVWLERVRSRHRRLKKDWLDDAIRVQDIYDCKDTTKYPFNILYSNTETILPALYNSTPRPEVARRFTNFTQGNASLDSAVSQVVQRALEYLADTNQSDYESYSDSVKAGVVSMLVPGMGQVRVRYHNEGDAYQTVCYDSVAFDRFVWAYARKWSAVPWVAFGHDLSKGDFELSYKEFISKEAYKDFDWKTIEDEDVDDGKEGADIETRTEGPALLIWEVWDYANKRIIHVCEQWKDETLLEEDYPAQLTSRFPCPAPLMFAKKGRRLSPIPAYKFYEKQAEELNELTRRLKNIVRAIRARGIFNASIGEIATLLNEDSDTVMVPSESAGLYSESGLEKAVWFWPADQLIEVAIQLHAQRENCKQTIFEIMGIGDILRGSSDPNETAKAQQIKNSWGSLRIKKGQVNVQSFCLDLFRISTELAVEYFTPATWQQMTQLPYLFDKQKADLQAQQQQWQQQVAQQQAMAQQQPPGQPPQPPPPSPIPPEQQALMALPSWEDITKVLKDRFQRTFRIDIETNSTVDLEATEDKEAISEFMTAFGQMMAGLQPLVENGTMSFEAAKVLLGEVMRRFRFGRRVEEVLGSMQPPKPKEDQERKAREAAAEAEKERIRADGSKRLLEAEQTITDLNAKLAEKELQLAGAKQGAELDGKQAAFDNKQQLHQVKTDYQGKMLASQTQQANEKIGMSAKQASMTMEQQFQTLMQKLQQQQQAIETLRAEEAKEDEVSDDPKIKALLDQMERMADGQQAMMEAIAQVAKMAGADRESEIMIGPDGRKKARSKLVLQ